MSGFLSSLGRFIYLSHYTVEYCFSLTVLILCLSYNHRSVNHSFLFSIILFEFFSTHLYSLDIFLVFYSLFIVFIFLSYHIVFHFFPKFNKFPIHLFLCMCLCWGEGNGTFSVSEFLIQGGFSNPQVIAWLCVTAFCFFFKHFFFPAYVYWGDFPQLICIGSWFISSTFWYGSFPCYFPISFCYLWVFCKITSLSVFLLSVEQNLDFEWTRCCGWCIFGWWWLRLCMVSNILALFFLALRSILSRFYFPSVHSLFWIHHHYFLFTLSYCMYNCYHSFFIRFTHTLVTLAWFKDLTSHLLHKL